MLWFLTEQNEGHAYLDAHFRHLFVRFFGGLFVLLYPLLTTNHNLSFFELVAFLH